MSTSNQSPACSDQSERGACRAWPSMPSPAQGQRVARRWGCPWRDQLMRGPQTNSPCAVWFFSIGAWAYHNEGAGLWMESFWSLEQLLGRCRKYDVGSCILRLRAEVHILVGKNRGQAWDFDRCYVRILFAVALVQCQAR